MLLIAGHQKKLMLAIKKVKGQKGLYGTLPVTSQILGPPNNNLQMPQVTRHPSLDMGNPHARPITVRKYSLPAPAEFHLIPSPHPDPCHFALLVLAHFNLDPRFDTSFGKPDSGCYRSDDRRVASRRCGTLFPSAVALAPCSISIPLVAPMAPLFTSCLSLPTRVQNLFRIRETLAKLRLLYYVAGS